MINTARARAHTMSAAAAPSNGAILVATDGRTLPLRSTSLDARAGGGLARVRLVQMFANPHAEPLSVTYQVPLPADGAVSGYRFRIGERVVTGEIDRKADARERFARAVMDGHTAALLEQDRSSVFTQELGNIPPGTTVEVELQIDQPLVWIGERGGSWEWRFPTVVAPRYLGAPGRVTDADRMTTRTTLDRLPVSVGLVLAIDDVQHGIECVSHAVQTTAAGSSTRVAFADASATLDRDVVVRWQVAGTHATTVAHRARPAATHAHGADAFALLTIVPPETGVTSAHVARDLIVLLDTSGSMHGAPLAQSQRLACALVDQLDDHDRLELIEFSTNARAWHQGPVAATTAQRAAAKQWIAALSAGGGTEMRTGIRAALASLRPEAQRQIVLVTDGQIGFESEIVAEIHHALPPGCRVHTVGVGSGVNRSLTSPAARAGRGVEIVIGIHEDPERAIARLCTHTRAPLVVDLAIEGAALIDHAPMHLPDLMAGHPATIAVRIHPQGGTIVIRGRMAAGSWEQRLALPPTGSDEGNAAVVARFGREQVEDVELRIAAGERGLDEQIERLGLEYAIATRMTSWIAIDDLVSVDTTAPVRHETMPQALPHGMSATGVGLRPAIGAAPALAQASDGGGFAVEGEAKRKGLLGSVVDSVRRATRMSAPTPMAAPPPAPVSRGRAAPSASAAPPAPGAPPRAKLERQESKPVAAPEADDFAEAQESRTMRTQAGTISVAVLQTTGRFVRLADGTLVIEIDLTDPLQWRTPASIDLHFDDGTIERVELDLTRSTRDASIAAGMQVRLVCSNVRVGTITLAVATDRMLLVVRP